MARCEKKRSPLPPGPLRRRSASSGLTLVELLVVMGIIAVVFGMSVVSFIGITRRSSREGAAEQVMDVLRSARMSAVTSGRGAVVRINPAAGTLYGLSTSVVAAWHFEQIDSGVTPGARRMDGAYTYANPVGTPIMEGSLGLAINFEQSKSTYVDCGSYPVYDQTSGIRLEAYVRPTGGSVGDNLGVISKWDGTDGYALYLHCDGDVGYSLHCRINTEDALIGDDGSVDLESDTGVVQPHTWTHVALECDGVEARLLYNGIVADTAAQTADIIPANDEPLLIGAVGPRSGGPTDFFEGQIDEPRVLSVAGGQRVHLPDKVKLVVSHDTRTIHYDAHGSLDLAYHNEPIYIAVGDPYQKAELAASCAKSDPTMTVRQPNPLPPTGGHVIVGDEIIHYSSASGGVLSDLQRGECGTDGEAHNQAENVYMARVVRIDQTGLVDRVD